MPEDFVIADINMDGFQVVRSQYFSRMLEPSMTLWNSAIAFNGPSYNALNNCEAVQLWVHPAAKRILVRPCPSKDPDAVNWIKNPTNPRTTKLECSMFTKQLFSAWGWDTALRYRTNGKLVKYDRKLMLLFDFNNPEKWKGTNMVREDE